MASKQLKLNASGQFKEKTHGNLFDYAPFDLELYCKEWHMDASNVYLKNWLESIKPSHIVSWYSIAADCHQERFARVYGTTCEIYTGQSDNENEFSIWQIKHI